MIHELKIWPEYFEAVRSGLKTFEIRKNDRGFRVGDTLLLREYNPNTEEFTGWSITRLISYMVEGPPFMAEGWAVLSMELSVKEWAGTVSKDRAWLNGYCRGYVNGCEDTTRIVMGTGTEKPVGIMSVTKQSEESIPVRAEQMIHEKHHLRQRPRL